MKKSIYQPKKLEALSQEIRNKIEKKKLSFFRRIINFFLKK
jgi:hypothetical protein